MNPDTVLRDLRRTAMFWLGMSTQQVADAESVVKNTMVDWRKHRKIQPNLFLGDCKG